MNGELPECCRISQRFEQLTMQLVTQIYIALGTI
jgi:hypothetical protein